MKVKTLEKKILKAMDKRPKQYVNIERYQETYVGGGYRPIYEMNISAGYYVDAENSAEIFQKRIAITHSDLHKLIILAAAKLDDLLDDFTSVVEIQ
jgi:hypothetical protein